MEAVKVDLPVPDPKNRDHAPSGQSSPAEPGSRINHPFDRRTTSAPFPIARRLACTIVGMRSIQPTVMPTRPFITTLLFLLPAFTSSIGASDWPMYRRDAGRRGITPDTVPANPQLSWSRNLPPLTPAFQDNRLQFDAGYEPVVVGQTLLLTSSLSNSLTAYDTRTGKEIWKFCTNGPIRFAPAVEGESVCVGSDDGCLYCVDLHSGELRWKHRAVPNARMLLGNRRLISVWPVRGGPVVDGGIVYFAAGVIPIEGAFVAALDIRNGNVVWRNDRLGYMYGKQPHNTESIGGLAPQGYLLLNEEELIVPCSNAYPARLNRRDGSLIDFELPTAGRYPGGWFAALDPDKARALRRGQLTFDELVNSRQHEDKLHSGKGGVPGLSREIRAGDARLGFDDKFAEVKGTVHSIVVADEALFVVTREGDLHCLRDAATLSQAEATQWQEERTALVVAEESGKFAKTLLARCSSDFGFGIVAGLTDGELVKALLSLSHLQVIAIDDDTSRMEHLRKELDSAGLLGDRVSLISVDPNQVKLPPYITSLLVSERDDVNIERLLQTLRPFGGLAAFHVGNPSSLPKTNPGTFRVLASKIPNVSFVVRDGKLPGSTEYAGDFSPSDDRLVRFPLGVLWFDDTLGHFKRSPQPSFDRGTMISRPKNWHVPRHRENNKLDYPLLPPILSDIYTGRVLDLSERPALRSRLAPSSPTQLESSQYRLPGQAFSTKPGRLVAGARRNPLTGASEPRAFPKTYGCDGGVDYGSLFTLRSGTAAFYDKSVESGTVFLSGPRSGCTNSIIPSGGVLNVPYYYEGCTCSYPLPIGMSLVAMPSKHEQWSCWGKAEIKPNSIQRIGINFAAPGDRMADDGTLWLDFPSIGGPSPEPNITATAPIQIRYHHSLRIENDDPKPWVSASMVEGLEHFRLGDMKPGPYTVRLYFAAPETHQRRDSLQQVDTDASSNQQNIRLQGQTVLQDFDIRKESAGTMCGICRVFRDIEVEHDFTLELSAENGMTRISGIELIRQD